MGERIGNAGKPRIVATVLDNAIAIIMSFLAAAFLPGIGDDVRTGVAVLLYFAYFLVLEGAWSRTLGKLACGLVVQRLDGKASGWREASIRTALRIFEVNPVLLGALPAGLAVMWSRRRQRLGDMLAKTIVARTRGDLNESVVQGS
jgi:uncharacterized RDD family membrane protein YckC